MTETRQQRHLRLQALRPIEIRIERLLYQLCDWVEEKPHSYDEIVARFARLETMYGRLHGEKETVSMRYAEGHMEDMIYERNCENKAAQEYESHYQ